MSPIEKIVLRVLLGAALVGGLWWGVSVVLGWRDAAHANAATATGLSKTAEATVGVTQDLGQANADGQRVDIVVRDARAAYQLQVEELSREDPSVAAFRDRPVPVGLRDAARARRCARDGSGGAASGCPHDDGTARAAGADQ